MVRCALDSCCWILLYVVYIYTLHKSLCVFHRFDFYIFLYKSQRGKLSKCTRLKKWKWHHNRCNCNRLVTHHSWMTGVTVSHTHQPSHAAAVNDERVLCVVCAWPLATYLHCTRCCMIPRRLNQYYSLLLLHLLLVLQQPPSTICPIWLRSILLYWERES